jgi:hypothetical protein
MVTLPTHTSHASQPLNMSCFKPFKYSFKKKKYSSMVRNNHLKLDKVILTGWVDKTLNQSLSKQNI